MRKLTQKQEKFVNELIANGGNQVKAALAAYDTENYNAAAATASENLNKPNIQVALESKKEDLMDVLRSAVIECTAICMNDIRTGNPNEKGFALKWINDLIKSIAPSAAKVERRPPINLNFPKA